MMKIEKVNVAEKFRQFSDYFNPRIAGELNGQHVKLVKLKGEFIFHKHDHEDELFFVHKGILKMAFEDTTLLIHPGEFVIVPKGVIHKPVAEQEVEVLLFEPINTVNTGDQTSELTRTDLKTI